jgi:CHAT domain-containing protein
VILSACNTFDTEGGGEGFNGLVRAFFHAGAPSILASQWSVDDQATRELMTKVLEGYAQANLPPAGWSWALAALGLSRRLIHRGPRRCARPKWLC